MYRWHRRENRGSYIVAHELTDGASGVYALFSFPDQHRGHIMKPAPCVWIEDIEKKITDTLDYNDRYMYMTETWYKQYIHFILRRINSYGTPDSSHQMKFWLRLGGTREGEQ